MITLLLLLACFDDTPRIQLDDIGLTLDFPSSWSLLSASGPFTAMAERPPKDALAMFTRATLSADQAEASYLSGMSRALSNHQLLANERLKHQAFEVRRIRLRGTTPGGTDLHHLTFIFQGPDESFTLTFVTKSERVPELAPEFQAIADSFKLEGPKTAPQQTAFWRELYADQPNLSELDKLIAEIDVNARDRRGKTPLILAIMQRKGALVRWLLAHGANPDHPNNDRELMQMVASPPILALLERHRTGHQPAPAAIDAPEPQNFNWASAEQELFSGIEEGRIARVTNALAKEVDLNARDRNYRLPALEMTRKLIAEFQELELDPGNLPAIQALLEQALAKKGASAPVATDPSSAVKAIESN